MTKFLLISSHEKDHSMIETRRLKNIVIFIQTKLSLHTMLFTFSKNLGEILKSATSLSSY